jgi:hypothetical protein
MMSNLTGWRLHLAIAPLFAGALVGCDLLSPEFPVRNLIDRAQAACERRDTAAFHAFLAEDYRDDSGPSRDEILHYVTNYLLVHRPRRCLAPVARIKLAADKTAHAEVYAALAAAPIASADDLKHTTADLLRLDIDLTPNDEGQLVVTHARWQPAGTKDLLAGAAARP